MKSKAQKEIDVFFRETPPDVDVAPEQNDLLNNVENGLNEEQLKALK